MDEMVRDQALLYTHLDSLIAQGSPDYLSFSAEVTIDKLSVSNLRGTNPTNAADRHDAIMMEA